MDKRNRYPRDVTDGQWAKLEPLIPPAQPAGRPRTVEMREVMNGIFYPLRSGCRKADACLLRQHAGGCDARRAGYKAQRRRFAEQTQHPDIIYEPSKCIDCGICIQIASASQERLGLTFVGRGFDVRVAVPFGESLAQGLRVAAAQCVAACPTGALAFKDDPRK